MKGYEKLDDVLSRAFNQASQGKGAERHATEAPFHEQPMQQVNAMVGVGFSNGQAIKKIVESQNMAPEKAVHELLGAICYLAGSIITIEARNDAPVFETMADLARAETFEYLDPKTWELHTVLGHQCIGGDWIAVPEGAKYLFDIKTGILSGKKIFFKHGADGGLLGYYGDSKSWIKATHGSTQSYLDEGDLLLWERV